MVRPHRLFVFYLMPDFTMLSLSSAIEVLRLANTAIGEEIYSWRLASADGGKVRASCALSLDVDSSIADERRGLLNAPRPFMAVVCGGRRVGDYIDQPAEAWLRECRQRAVAIASLSSGAYLLGRAGLLKDKRCTVHWEDYPGFSERFHSTSVGMGLYDVDEGVHTCAGGTAAIDMMLSVVSKDHGEAVVSWVCERALIDRVREPTERQRLPFAAGAGRVDPTVARVVKTMEDNMAEPLDIDLLAAVAKRSRRQIERLFLRELNLSPARYYMRLRLERANLLLRQTTLPVVEIAIASGFISASHFSKCYRGTYGCSPQATRSVNRRLEAPINLRKRGELRATADLP